jgi:chorismate mutase/prephenate dehydrogenase
MDQQIVVACPGREPAACQWLVDQLAAWGNIVMTLEPKEHDEVMDLVQGARHFATFAFGRFLSQRQVKLDRSLEFSSPIYRLELGMIGRLFAQDASLYADIIFASPERRALLKEFIGSVASTHAMLEAGDTEQFCREFQQIADWFGPFCEQAMRESSFLIDKLVERF